MRKCSLESLNLVFAEIAKNATLYMPVDDANGKATYTKWAEGMQWSNALNTVRSPKDFFFPQMENLVEFKTEGKNIEIIDTPSNQNLWMNCDKARKYGVNFSSVEDGLKRCAKDYL